MEHFWNKWIKFGTNEKMMRETKIKKQITFDDRGVFGYIDQAPQKPISTKATEFPRELVDMYGKRYTCYLRTMLKLDKIIPETISYHAEGRSPEGTKKILQERGIDITQPLAYYVFQRK